MTVAIHGISRCYGPASALSALDLAVAEGEFVALLGPSGAGKTTLLRIIAGLDRPDAGNVVISGRDVRNLSPRDRQIGFVFQNYALFRHMTVADNIAFGLTVKPRRQRPPRAEITARVNELLDLMRLSGLGGRFPAQLSGGQRQRAALARALAVNPKVLLLDEPFGALDAKVRAELREWLRDLQRQLRLTTIFVTHDQHEALQLADRVAILNHGRIEQIGTPAEVYDHPATPFVTEFLGATNRIEVEIRDGRVFASGRPLPLIHDVVGDHPDGPATLFVRPHDIAIGGIPVSGQRARIRGISVNGPQRLLDIEFGWLRLSAEIPRDPAAVAPILETEQAIAFKKAILFSRSGAAHSAGLRRLGATILAG
ncbi:MAG: sulfate/molybdate ABC transporter ATP-binding protein [Stellaceae bacterium]